MALFEQPRYSRDDCIRLLALSIPFVAQDEILGADQLEIRIPTSTTHPLSPTEDGLVTVPFTELSDPKDKVSKLAELVRSLPQPNRDTLNFLMEHLRK